ncbi:uL15m family ribosomal protein [Methanosarcina sp. UBA5]|uniref:uL15m family ribosomal protein n=1 Tax=Methanosarcina sp. UBA5 TaxID=1915593 RepID=UPI0025CF797B|nr:uL15 family ribosomal protein [Methanosarcina sp. UBA5]
MDTKKFRGSRTCGGGTHKNRRGAGNRGGRGKAGGCKHHFVRAMFRGYSYGKHGFKLPAEISRDISIVNVGELDELAPYLVEEGLAEIKDGAYHINLENLGIEKVLGSGRVTKNLAVTSVEFSASAREKIENAGGSCINAE